MPYGADLQLGEKTAFTAQHQYYFLLAHLHSDHILDYPSLADECTGKWCEDHTIQVYVAAEQAMTKSWLEGLYMRGYRYMEEGETRSAQLWLGDRY